ncbi:DUF3370 domain-containing protein [Fortiea contorta]|uniref:DUF3370 domain-containing protein n=1 Tax=Fortiea contorta TaxID=1892405 RepID=UPI00034945BA|nr:DUF3370 domain-containing protein [Fortiea contorta]
MSLNQFTNKIITPLCLFLLGLAISQNLGYTNFQAIGDSNNSTVVAQTSPKSSPQEIIQPGEIRALPGKLDTIPVFNSNSPEWIKTEGILLSTFPPDGKKTTAAHLNFPFQGRFDIFAHHYTHTPKDLQTLYLGVIVHNPGKKSVTVDVLQGASYLMQDAPFVTLAPYIDNNDNKAFSGPGDRAVSDVIRGIRQVDIPAQLLIPPGQSRLLLNHPIPVKNLEKPVNGRSSLLRLRSSGKVYTASLAMFARKNADGGERAPTLAEWQALLNNGNFAGPRDKIPTPPNATSGALIYGRVAGVSQGSQWQAKLVDDANTKVLTIPQPGQGISYALNTLKGGRLGSGQIQTAKMLVRYPDTAYEAHGNYGVEYNLSLPLSNNTKRSQKVAITLETPLKEDKLSQSNLRFRKPSLDFPFFRGTVRLRYVDEQGQNKTRYVHLWHRTGQVLEPLLQVVLPPSTKHMVQVDLIYPPDSTPPQVLTIRTL